MKVTENIYSFKNRKVRSNTKIIKGEKNILIDPGTTSLNHVNYLISELNKININHIDEIWLTHVHPDHSQAIPFLEKKFKAKLRAHPIAKSILESPHPASAFIEQQINAAKLALDYLLPNETKKHKFFLSLMKMIIRFYVNTITTNWRKTEVNYVFTPGEIIYGWQVLSLPGHTPEEVGFYSKDKNILISGDIIARKKKRTTPVLNTITSNIDEAISTLKVMQTLNPKLIIPGHCGIISEPAKLISQFLNQAETLKSRALDVFNKIVYQSEFSRQKCYEAKGMFSWSSRRRSDYSNLSSETGHPDSPQAKKDLSFAFCRPSEPVNETTFLTVQRSLRLFYNLWKIHPPGIRFQERLALSLILPKSIISIR